MSMFHNENSQFCASSLYAKQEIALQGLLAEGSQISTQWKPSGVMCKNVSAVGQEE